jgi:hypothetical protein
MSAGIDPYILGLSTGIVVGSLISWIGRHFIDYFFDETEPKRSIEGTDVPQFQQTLIELSKIPGLGIKGEGVHIKGPELKGDGKT